MLTTLTNIDRVLRGESLDARRTTSQTLGLFAFSILAVMFYGAVMGTFTGLPEGRRLQLVYSAIKVPLLFGVTFGVSLPSFFVVNTLLGLRNDFAEAMTALLETQVAVGTTLLAFAPLTAVWYVSTTNYQAAILFNSAMFGASAFAGQIVLRRHYAALIARNPKHRLVLRGWLVIYAFVGIQMGYVLRPFIGDPDRAVHFMREDAWGNAYIVVIDLVRSVLHHSM